MTFTIFLQPTEGAENTDKIKIHEISPYRITIRFFRIFRGQKSLYDLF